MLSSMSITSDSSSLPLSPRRGDDDMLRQSRSAPGSRRSSNSATPRNPLDYHAVARGSLSTLRTSGAACFGRQPARPATPVAALELTRSGLSSTGSLSTVQSFSTPQFLFKGVMPPLFKPSPAAATFARSSPPNWSLNDGPSTHSYVGATSTLSRSDCPVFSTARLQRGEPALSTTSMCPVHSYQSLPPYKPSPSAASFGRDETPRTRPSSSGPALVHAYASHKSTLSRAGAVPFGTATAASSLLRTPSSRELNVVHAYAGSGTTLKRSGASAFGRQPARPEGGLAWSKQTLSRSGLLASTSSCSAFSHRQTACFRHPNGHALPPLRRTSCA